MNAVDLRLRLSLYARVLVALGVLGTFSIVVGLVLSAGGVLLGVAGLGLVFKVLDAVAGAPRIAPHTPIPPVVVALTAVLGIATLLSSWETVTRYTSTEYLFEKDDPVSWLATIWVVGCLYLAVVEGSAALVAALSSLGGVVVALLLGAVVTVVATVAEVRREVRELRERLLEDSVPVTMVSPDVDPIVRRLARLVDVPAPEVYVTSADRPESFTVGTGESATIVVSTGLLDALSEEELEAVLAHEVSHLANGDSRVMGAALVPVLSPRTSSWTNRSSSPTSSGTPRSGSSNCTASSG